MSEEFGGMFNEMFIKCGKGMCRLGLNGNIAVKTSNGYKTYDVDSGRLTNVTQFCFDVGQDLFIVMPTTKVKKGDILIIDGKPKCVIENNKNKTIKVMDYENSAIQEIVPERHVFMGQAYFYRKIVSMFGTSFLKGGKGFGKIAKIMALKSFMGGNENGNDGFGGMLGMMAMANMMGGKSESGFSDMFDFDLDYDDEGLFETDDTDDIEETEEELEAKLAKLKAKKAGK